MRMSRKAAAIGMMVLIPFMILCARLFFFYCTTVTEVPSPAPEIQEERLPPPVKHRSLEVNIGRHVQKINLLEVDIRPGEAEVVPVLSFDRVFGFETLSSMASRKNAYAMTNGGFYYEYGQPSGMVVIDGELISRSSGKYPVFIVEDGRASFQVIEDELWVSCNESKLPLDGINVQGKPGQAILYTSAYGQSNRLEGENISVAIEDGKVKGVQLAQAETKIPKNGMLISFFPPYTYGVEKLPLKSGDRVEIGYIPSLGPSAQAYECGSWIVRDGEVVIGDKDNWVGVLTNRDPRTAIGIKKDGSVLLITVDGRQPGYSAGVTAKELGAFLLELGVENAAMLDGGASTEMIIEGKIINRPSHKGEERSLAGGLMIRYQKKE